ncbi:MAG: ABC transporter ATP-binding protein [Defluviitaleaceae bacterium]|nr:ABC transporter ATP-binding protein [Defluviitaleaceae bacterium]
MSNDNIPAVAARNLTKRYGTSRAKNGALAVDGIDITVPAGCCCGFLGKNGAGKTTTIKMLVGLKKPTAGEISIMGAPQVFGGRKQLPFGYLPDVPTFYPYMTGAEFLTFCAKLCGVPAGKRPALVKELLDRVGLGKARGAIAGYSRGMKQRLGIAQALVNDPKVIFMDEPISALDPIGRRDVADIIRGLKAGGDCSIIFSTHILNDVEEICDYVLIIEKGRIMAQDYLTHLKLKYRRNKAEIRFYEAEAAQRFKQAAEAENTEILLEAASPLSFEARLKGDTAESEEAFVRAASHLSRGINALLGKHELPIESYTAHNPALEEIFYAAINPTPEGGAL